MKEMTNQEEPKSENGYPTMNESEATHSNNTPSIHQDEIEVVLESTSLSQSDSIDFLNEESFNSNSVENDWIQYCMSASISDTKCTYKEFEEWLSSQNLENDPLYSILSHCEEKTVRPNPQDDSFELDCDAFHEYPLTENDLLSQHEGWRVLEDKIFDGDVLLYSGNISGDKLNGEGRWYYRNHTIMYNGFFSSNLWNGYGCMFYPNGTLFYKGYWKNGKMKGKGMLYKPVNLPYCNAEQRKYIWENENNDYLSIAKSHQSKFYSFKLCVCLRIPRELERVIRISIFLLRVVCHHPLTK